MPSILQLLASLLLTGGLGTALADAPRGLLPGIQQISVRQSVPMVETRLRQVLASRGLALIAVIDHAQEAAEVGAAMQPMLTVLFGTPDADTAWLQCQGSAALDLPHKMVIRQEGPVTRIEWNDPHYLSERHDMQHCDLPLEEVANMLKRMARETAGN